MNQTIAEMLRKIVVLLESHEGRLTDLETEETRENASESELIATLTDLATRLHSPESLVPSELS